MSNMRRKIISVTPFILSIPSTESLSASDNSDETTSDADYKAEPANRPKIHFAVRLVPDHKHLNAKCLPLSDYRPLIDKTSSTYTWYNECARGLISETLEVDNEFEEYFLENIAREDKPSRTELALLKTWFRGEESALLHEWKLKAEDIKRSVKKLAS
ncbi:hypothetical protein GQ44DRAFT_706711 [Phaeosphaeriaceae sp. PMI808]|nr:hypothetical protein GQ44DRAFT_706711 [Phaeosphaeriaceae sp. PMI808]